MAVKGGKHTLIVRQGNNLRLQPVLPEIVFQYVNHGTLQHHNLPALHGSFLQCDLCVGGML